MTVLAGFHHVSVVTADLERLTAEWERLGDRQATEVTKA